MRSVNYLYLIPIVVRIVVAFTNGRGDNNGLGSGNIKGHSFGGSNHNGHGSIGSHGQGQGNVNGFSGVHTIVSAINSAGQEVHTVNAAIRRISAGGTIEHLDSKLQSLSSTIRATSATISTAGPLQAGDVESLKLAIQPFQQSIGTLVTQLVGRRDTIARLCGCRTVQDAVNHIRGSTRIMFDGIKNRFNHGGSPHGRHGFNTLHPFDSGIASFLNHGYNAFGFGNCINFEAHTTTQTTTTWAPSTVTASTTVVVTNTVTKTVTSISWISDVYSTYTTGYSSSSWSSKTTRSQATNVPSDSSGFGRGGNSESSNTYGHQDADD
ncbi:hypothetical protein F4776DRAFT_670424 [Hypoxylon sp. NC0597]|nr:hypothetical protein F4776DRAFT_670424 [Hypoxylon sp. NC0597]